MLNINIIIFLCISPYYWRIAVPLLFKMTLNVCQIIDI